MSRAHLGWLIGFFIVAGGYLGLRSQMGNFVNIAGVPITPVNLGEIGTVFLLLAAAYLFRKRLGIGAFGRLDGWLWSHIYLGMLGMIFIWYHSRQRFSPKAWLPNAAMVLLILVALSGIIGRLLYIAIPRLLSRLPDYNPPRVLQERITALETEAAACAAFKSGAFQTLHDHLLRRPLDLMPAAPGWGYVQQGRVSLPPAELTDFDRMTTLLARRGELLATLGRRQGYRRLLDWWWTIHVRLTEAGVIFAALHVIDALLFAGKWK